MNEKTMQTEEKSLTKTRREVELEIACELGKKDIQTAIDYLAIGGMDGFVQASNLLLKTKARMIRALEGRCAV